MNSTAWRRFSHAALAFLSVCAFTGATNHHPRSMTVVNSHPASKSKDDIRPKGLLSAYVRVEGGVVLFDTGSESAPILSNVAELRLDPSLISAVVLSHDDPEHFHNLAGVLRGTDMKPKVYVPASVGDVVSTRNPGVTVIAVSKPTSVLPDVWLVGPVAVEFEGETSTAQALVVDRPEGLVVIVGCSSPAVATIVDQVKEVFGHRRIDLVAGGIHLRRTSKDEVREVSLRMQQMGVRRLALSECTGAPALKIFREEWGERLEPFDFGDTIDF